MKIGIITFHSVYNYGAVLQAYSLQKIFEDIGKDSELIDFTRVSQLDYTSLYSKRKGFKSILKNCIILPMHFKRRARLNKFNRFIDGQLVKSSQKYTSEQSLSASNDCYDVFFTGSDQVWNTKKSTDYSPAYFLDFVDKNNNNRFAYAASIGTSDECDLTKQRHLLARYKAISCREKRGCDIVSKITGKEIPLVLDPTLLVDIKHLSKYVRYTEPERPYLFYYSLDGFDKRKNNTDIINALSEKFGLEIKMVTPEWVYRGGKTQQITAGIEDFLSLIANAELVCTNSFHGTALAIKFNRNFYVLEQYDGRDDRKKTVLEEFGLEDRLITKIAEISNITNYTIDYNTINTRAKELEKHSMNFLKKCIDESEANG